MKLNFLNTFYFYFSFFLKRSGIKIFIVLIFTFLSAVFEGFGVLLFLPILQTINSESQIPTFSVDNSSVKIIDFLQRLFDFLNINFDTANVLIFMCISFLLKGFFFFLTHRYSSRLTANLIPKLKMEFFDKIQCLDYTYFIGKDSGTFANIINEQINKSVITFVNFIYTSTHFLTSVLYIIMAFYVSPTFGLAAVFIGLIVMFVFRGISNLVRNLSIDNSNVNANLTQIIIEIVTGYKYLKGTNSFKRINNKVTELVSELESYKFRTGVAEAVTMSVREPFLAMMLAIILFLQIDFFEVDVSVTLIAMILFYRGMNSVFNSQRSWQNTLEFSGSVDFLEFYSQEFRYDNNMVKKVCKLPNDWNKLVFKDVSFDYNKSNSDIVLKKLNLAFIRDKFTVILGKSGSGKTTLLDLIIGLIQPDSGKIYFANKNDRELRDLSPIENIGFVSQDPVVFTDTIENNITLWNAQNLPKDLLKSRIEKVLQMTELSEFISGLSMGLQTPMGDRGVKISGGQRQRICLARELFKNPEVLILDEATSALDQQTEKQILSTLKKLKGNMTIIFVTHRQTIAELADKTVEL